MTRDQLVEAMELERFGPAPERESLTTPPPVKAVVVRVNEAPSDQDKRRRELCQALNGTYIDDRPDNVIPLRKAS